MSSSICCATLQICLGLVPTNRLSLSLSPDNCPINPALASTKVTDFTKGADDSVWDPLPGTTLTYDGAKGAIFSIANVNQAPTIATHKYIFGGRLDVIMQAAPGAGVVTSIVLQSDDLDEVDWVSSIW